MSGTSVGRLSPVLLFHEVGTAECTPRINIDKDSFSAAKTKFIDDRCHKAYIERTSQPAQNARLGRKTPHTRCSGSMGSVFLDTTTTAVYNTKRIAKSETYIRVFQRNRDRKICFLCGAWAEKTGLKRCQGAAAGTAIETKMCKKSVFSSLV